MAGIDATNSPDSEIPPQAEQATDGAAPSWLEGLPHNFDGWGPKTPDADGSDEMAHAHSELTWNGEVDDQNHHVWSFRRAARRHH